MRRWPTATTSRFGSDNRGGIISQSGEMEVSRRKGANGWAASVYPINILRRYSFLIWSWISTDCAGAGHSLLINAITCWEFQRRFSASCQQSCKTGIWCRCPQEPLQKKNNITTLICQQNSRLSDWTCLTVSICIWVIINKGKSENRECAIQSSGQSRDLWMFEFSTGLSLSTRTRTKSHASMGLYI